MPGEPARPWWLTRVLFTFAREAAGALKHPAFPTPSLGEGYLQNSGAMRRGMRRCVLRHGRARPGHPRLPCLTEAKTWMPGTRPGMTTDEVDPSSLFDR